MSAERKAVLQRRIRFIVAATITYNVLEAIIAITAGRSAGSAALFGFGLDSTVEVLSAAAVAWQFSSPTPEKREKAALRVIAVAFFTLAGWVSFEAVASLVTGEVAEHSTVGIALAVASVIIMPAFSWFERRTGVELGSATAVADSKQTLVCAYLSAALLVGLVLNSAFGWSWADPLAALFIAAFAMREGLEALRGETCTQPVAKLVEEDDEAPACSCH
ncbi:MAG TPA: cation transporter [Candidatus Corynebacterium gallistercoris]|uniref:Cation transporter n=1 Tax=Candidatus Corynebacterium gallistercoris TaxID=2838530 RepID=A0A9D1RYV4_9CORY|nr:cation transporter [Candidatus Corynebacterium gallistercoris]